MLSYRHQVFLTVAENLSFSKAAETLFISQPAVSRHVKQLESVYNLSLFERRGNSIALTQAGIILVSYLNRASDIQRDLQFEIGQLNETKIAKGRLILGASTTVALYILPNILSGFSRQYPNLELRLVNRNSENILKALLNHEIDLGIVEVKKKKPTVKYDSFVSDEVVAVCSSRSPLVAKGNYGIEELRNLPIAIREQGSGTLAVVADVLKNRGIRISDLNIVIRLGGTEALKNFVLADECLGFLPYRSIVKEVRRGELVLLDIDNLQIHRKFFFVQRQGAQTDSLNTAFIRFAKLHNNI